MEYASQSTETTDTTTKFKNKPIASHGFLRRQNPFNVLLALCGIFKHVPCVLGHVFERFLEPLGFVLALNPDRSNIGDFTNEDKLDPPRVSTVSDERNVSR